MPQLVWFRRDLRIHDHSALYNATRESSDGVIAVFTITPQQWLEHDEAPRKVLFWLESLAELKKRLDDYNIPLHVLELNEFSDVAGAMLKFAQKHQVSKIHFNLEYEINEAERDQAVISEFEKVQIATATYHDRLLFPPNRIQTKSGTYYTVFTPYKRSFIEQLTSSPQPELGLPQKQPRLELESSDVPTSIKGFKFEKNWSEEWKAGEETALRRLRYFCDNLIASYDSSRDIPEDDQTSKLSPYLAAGIVSPRQCLAKAVEANQGSLDRKGTGATTWISELIWREFYHHVLVGFPRVCRHQPFVENTRKLTWSEDQSHLDAWKQGKTGYPIVDAAMRQLNQTGWMHNRLRMISAMFLSKHLFIDWREGEKYFMQNLIDGDLAANNGGWQWSASTGTDAAPYFRIFNPFRQSERFDKDGKFIRRFCPELESIRPTALHDPSKFSEADRAKVDYPKPIVEHSKARQNAIDKFKALDK